MARSYIESKIDAFGRIYAIRVTDEYDYPFQVGQLTLDGKSLEDDYTIYAKRSEAIKELSTRALNWLRDND